jgi:putative oxidoreductase
MNRILSRNTLTWTLQTALAAVFLLHGLMFLNPPPEIAVLMNAAMPRWFQLFLGVAEVMAAAGLTLPALTRVLPFLVAWAAGGTMIVLGSATIWHIVRAEYSSALITTVLFTIALVVARAPRVRHRRNNS